MGSHIDQVKRYGIIYDCYYGFWKFLKYIEFIMITICFTLDLIRCLTFTYIYEEKCRQVVLYNLLTTYNSR